jgi:hypothetical protein
MLTIYVLLFASFAVYLLWETILEILYQVDSKNKAPSSSLLRQQ